MSLRASDSAPDVARLTASTFDVVGSACVAHKLHVRRDDHQQIIEVVRDVGDQIAQRTHAAQLTARRFDGKARRHFRLPAFPCGLLRIQAPDRECDQEPYRDAGQRSDCRDQNEIVTPARRDDRCSIARRNIKRIVADPPISDQLDMIHGRIEFETAIELVAAEGIREWRVREGSVPSGPGG